MRPGVRRLSSRTPRTAVEPVVAVGPRRVGRLDGEQVRRAEVVRRQSRERVVELVGSGVEDRPAQAGEVERLRSRRHRDRPRRDLGAERGERHVVVPGVDELGVDLVADDDEVVLGRQLGDHLQLGSIEHPAGGVLRMAEDPQAGRAGPSTRAARRRSSSS